MSTPKAPTVPRVWAANIAAVIDAGRAVLVFRLAHHPDDVVEVAMTAEDAALLAKTLDGTARYMTDGAHEESS
ncbi:hypothetical protein EV188_106242 [Actinomycetospora succinea]|uniref:Uncharacterized protein n=1 Tax=Actinomycetospora succinea TaxID=663603 RepID=A0A4R6V5L3_9PSEU|nr:hypothetical protein [Actinomycetospora succinea]TDQ54095.1 hypothetical protein EV188_106242 [Actinomycetospora succinea]